jgi:hypothetical protein
MPLTPSFSVSQSSATPNVIAITDTSSGNDSSVAKRRIYLLQADGTYLVPSGVSTQYIDWALADTTKSVDVLSADTALQITVQWLDSSNVVLYTVTTAFGFSAYGETFYYNLTQLQQANPQIINATTFYTAKMMLRVELDSAAQAISFAGDINSAQQCFNRANNFIINQNYYF